jgi:hypothetical protein
MELLVVFLIAGICFWILRGFKIIFIVALGIVIALFRLLTYRKPKPYYTYTRS